MSASSEISTENRTTGQTYACVHDLSSRQIELIMAGTPGSTSGGI
ncbi:MAG: hypothetical protein ACRDZV_05710 [Acidimicrobiia bacterium]